MLLYSENQFRSKGETIKYLLRESNNKKLIVIFSGFDTPPKYRYTLTLRGFDINQLFILDDFKNRGGYYIGQAPKFNFESATIELIEKIIKEKNIKRSDVICAGSSKGGWAALYYAIKYNFGYSIIGAPQIKIMTYLNFVNYTDVIENMTGGDKQYVSTVENHLLDIIEDSKNLPEIFLQIGVGDDHHYYKHILPFIDVIRKKEYYKNLNLKIENYGSHNDVAVYFPRYLCEKIIYIFPSLKQSLFFKKIQINQNANMFCISADANCAEKYAFYVFCDGKLVHTVGYNNSNSLQYTAKTPGMYKFACFAIDNKGNKISNYGKNYEVH